VLAATVTGTVLGLVPAAAPLAIVIAFGTYVAASLRGGRLARSRLGHAAGVLNYVLAGLIAGSMALPGSAWPPLLYLSSLSVVAVNLGAVLVRALPPRARAQPGAGRGGR
jgi:hypothetical protein